MPQITTAQTAAAHAPAKMERLAARVFLELELAPVPRKLVGPARIAQRVPQTGIAPAMAAPPPTLEPLAPDPATAKTEQLAAKVLLELELAPVRQITTAQTALARAPAKMERLAARALLERGLAPVPRKLVGLVRIAQPVSQTGIAPAMVVPTTFTEPPV